MSSKPDKEKVKPPKLKRERDALLDALRDIRACSEYEAHGIADQCFRDLNLSRWPE